MYVLSFPVGYNVLIISSTYIIVIIMLNKNTLGVKKVRGQSEATMVI